MTVSYEDIKKTAFLTKIDIDKEDDKLVRQMIKIVEFANGLNELDLDDVAPLMHIVGDNNRFRRDEIEPSLSREELLKNAAEVEAGCFTVPKTAV